MGRLDATITRIATQLPLPAVVSKEASPMANQIRWVLIPLTKPCSPADLHATIFHALGIDPRHTIPARDGRPLPMCDGNPLPLFA